MTFSLPAQTRRLLLTLRSLSLAALFLPALLAAAQTSQSAPVAPQPQDSRKYDVALSGFAQISTASNGNSVREDTNESLGGLLSFRRPYRPWLGYEVNYGYTRFSEFYGKGVTVIQNNVHEFSAAYLLQAPPVYRGIRPFLTIGTGIMLFAPTPSGGSGRSPQMLPLFEYSFGLNRLVLSDHIGVRVQFRGLKYKTPSYGEFLLDSHTLRTTMEPAIGVYYRF